MKRNLAIKIISILLILLWVYAAVSKVSETGRFKWELNELPWLGTYAQAIAYALPVVEIILAVLILIPATRITGLCASLIIIFAFIIYLIIISISGKNLPCFCGGIIFRMTLTQHIILIILLSAITIIGTSLNSNSTQRIH